MSIRSKLILILLLFSIIPVITIGLVEIRKSREALKKQMGGSSLELAHTSMKRINEYLYSKYVNIQGWTKNKCLNGITNGDKYGNIYQFLLGLSEVHDEYHYINCLNKEGLVIASSNTDLIGRDLSAEKGFKEALNGNKTMQDVASNELAGGYAVVMSVPVLDIPSQSEVIGVLTVALKWDNVNEMITGLKVGGKEQSEANHIMLLNKDGLAISCFDPGEMFSDNLIEIGIKAAAYAQEHKEGYLTETSEHGLLSFSTYTFSREYKDLPHLHWNLILLQDPKAVFAIVGSLKKTLIFTLLGAVGFLITISLLFANRISKPILTVVSAAKAIGKGNLNTKIPIKSNDEIGLLSGSFNKMAKDLQESNHRLRENETLLEQRVVERTAELERANEELLKMQKLESIGVLAGGIAHDFNNYLQGILFNSNLVMSRIDKNSKSYEILVETKKAVLQAKSLTQQLLTFSKGGDPVKEIISISEVIMDSANLALSGSNVRCKFDIPYGLRQVEADKGQMNQVINNLFINAGQAMPEGGTIKVKVENINIEEGDSLPLNEGRYLNIIVADQGVGIHQEHLQKIFDPYFTTKQKSSGLGLSIAYSIVKKHDGLITVESEMGVGTTFHIYFPACKVEITGETAPDETKSEEETTSLAGKKILFMDDDAIISMSVTRGLKDLECEVESARNGTVAVSLYKSAIETGKAFDAVILDLTIPGGMGGVETIRKLLRIDPDVKAIVASGYSNDSVMSNFKEYGFKGVVEKLYEIYELDEILQKVIMGREESV